MLHTMQENRACDAVASNSSRMAFSMATAAPKAEVMHAATTAEIYQSGVAQQVQDATYSQP